MYLLSKTIDHAIYNSPKITSVWLNVPYLLKESIVPANYREFWFSREQNANALIINAAAIQYVQEQYQQDAHLPELSPFNVDGAHTGIPPVYIQVCGQDPVRDDGLIYEKVLKDHGVETGLDAYAGVPHGFADMFTEFPLAQKSYYDTLRGIGWLLH